MAESKIKVEEKQDDEKAKVDAPKEKRSSSGKKNKKKLIIIIISAAVFLLAVAVAGYFIFKGGKNGENKNTNSANEEEEARRAIDGVYDQVANQNLYPIAIMIENLSTVRPQAGLSEANLVYEALAEGGITRFMALFIMTGPIDRIGPVRSARPYFLDWAKEYDALYGHVGGSPKAMSLISQYDIFNLDQFYDARYFWRDKAIGAPHNVFTSTKLLMFALHDKEAPQAGDFETYKFKDDASFSSRPEEAKNITIDYSSFSYKVEYQYNREENVYLRSQGGEAFESEGKGQIKAKNVVVQYVNTAVEDEGRLSMVTIGTGKSIVFQDGLAITGTWQKESLEKRTKFYNEAGEEIEFNAGQTWIQVVPADRQAIYN